MSNLIEVGKTYTHYKVGNRYTVLNIAKHSETGEQMVVYQAEYGWKDIFVRPSSMWSEVIPEDRQTSYDQGIRFKLVDEDGWCSSCHPTEILPMVDGCKDCDLNPQMTQDEIEILNLLDFKDR